MFDVYCLDLDNICGFDSLLVLGAIHTERVFALKNARCGQWNGEDCKVLRHFFKCEILFREFLEKGLFRMLCNVIDASAMVKDVCLVHVYMVDDFLLEHRIFRTSRHALRPVQLFILSVELVIAGLNLIGC